MLIGIKLCCIKNRVNRILTGGKIIARRFFQVRDGISVLRMLIFYIGLFALGP